jgi:N-6 DNA methylase
MPDLFDPPSDTRPLTQRLEDFGCHHVIELRNNQTAPAYALADYLDLIPGSKGDRSTALPIYAVVEHQNAPLLYITFDDQPGVIEALQKELANRSDASWLGILRPGELEVRPVTFKPKPTALLIKKADDNDAALFFQRLVHGQVDKKAGSPKAMDYVAKLIFDQLMFTARTFVPEGGTTDPSLLTALEVLSMCGRALFFRFLMDRKIVVPADCTDICEKAKNLSDVFSSPEKAALTSAWLDATFNGDFLRLFSEQQDQNIPSDDKAARTTAYRRYYKSVSDNVGVVFFHHLRAITKGLPVPRDSAEYEDELELEWADLNFAHIPIGVLSQVYESYSHWVEGEAAKQASVHYTPLPIARMMVDQCFGPGAVKKPAHARVLDPACGAGIFLVLAFRRLIQKRWEHDEVQPDTQLIRQMLRQQLTGFDVSESALRLAALSLYITAIEMDPAPRPVKKLKFDDLRGSVLHNFSDPDHQGGFQLGSLGQNVPKEFDGAFNLVVGNPPWTKIQQTIPRLTEIGVEALKARKLESLAATYENPDNNPDIPFFWRATLWAAPDALIALALPARLILHASARGAEAWLCILQAVKITGLINGADVRKTGVWPEMDVPWCLLFTRNIDPGDGAQRFHYACPIYDRSWNPSGRFRIDYQTLLSLDGQLVRQKPWLLKTLLVGTWRDVEIVDSILRSFPKSLIEEWRTWDPEEERTGRGFDLSPEQKQVPSDWLADLQLFEKPDKAQFQIVDLTLKNKGPKEAHAPRRKELYEEPLVIVIKSPGHSDVIPKAYISSQALAFKKTYYGYSCQGHSEAEMLSKLIYLLPHSTVCRYFILMTSALLGADRQMFLKEEFDAIPFPDVTTLPKATKTTIKRLAHDLEHNPPATKPWDQIDDFFFSLYQIEPRDAQVMRDTLFSAAPYRTAGKAAFAPVTFDSDRDYCTRTTFAGHLQTLLQPFFGISGYQVAATIRPPGLEQRPQFDVWGFIVIHRSDQPVSLDAALLSQVTLQADTHGASRVIIRLPGQRGLLLGLLNEQRWWTQTRASFCAQRIVRDYLDAFDLRE